MRLQVLKAVYLFSGFALALGARDDFQLVFIPLQHTVGGTDWQGMEKDVPLFRDAC